jgi:predicted pyridoxine 5'-phosphate oxidase superfamily flavin-nucleotide-binding protein
MAYGFLDIAATPSVKAAQAANGSAALWESFAGDRARDRFTDAEAGFIARRDSFYIATVSETGWPYVQHRGGPPGFLRLLDDRTLAFADFRGNRQYISLGNLGANDRAALILMDYPARRRLKIYAHIEARDLATDPELADTLATPGYRARPERALVLHLDAFDWNCPQHITPRFTEAELDEVLAPMRARIDTLEAENRLLRQKLAAQGD